MIKELSLWMVVVFTASLGGCAYETPEPFREAVTLGGEVVHPGSLNRGRSAYNKYCQSCHGAEGDGRGISSVGLATPPRDFRIATYKFARAIPGELPQDEGLASVINHGLDGTAMLHWDLPPNTLSDVLQYLKTFSPQGEGWRDPEMEKGPMIVASEDPYKTRPLKEAVSRGRALYHGYATCYGCHPAYETRAEINVDRAEFGSASLLKYRPKLWLPEPKETYSYTVPVEGDPTCSDEDECSDSQVCQFGRCEEKGWLMPPDFTLNSVRTGTQPKELYLVIAAGIPGTAMPTWKGVLSEKDIWAIAYYVSSLTKLKDTPEAETLKGRLRADTEPLVLPRENKEEVP